MTQHACLNPRCIGIRIYTGLTVDAAGAFVETYTCTRCHAVSVEAAASADVVVYLDAEATVESADTGEYQGQARGEDQP